MSVLFPKAWKNMLLFDKYKDVHYIITNRNRNCKRVYICENILTFDTETYMGKCRLICDNKNRVLFKPSFDDCLKFLCYKYFQKNTYRFFFNIDFDISAILKCWNDIIEIDKLSKGIQVYYKQYKLKWIKSKFFSITYKNKTIYFVDLFNFFHLGLNKSAKLYLKDISKDKIDGNKLNNDIFYWNRNHNDIIKYCIQDCIITEKLAWKLIEAIKKANISLPKLLVSSGSLAKYHFRSNCHNSNLKTVPRKLIQIAYDTYFGGKFEVQSKGYFENLIDSDINSEYPSFIRKWIDLEYGVWQKIYTLPKREIIGFFLVDIDIPADNHISTIQLRLKNNMILSVNGIIKKRWFTWYDLDLMREYITKIHRAFVFTPKIAQSSIPKEKQQYFFPYRKEIDHLYKMKNKYKDTDKTMYLIFKLTMNAFYGSTIERHENIDNEGNKKYVVGKLFNPIFATNITSYGRWKILKDVPKAEWKHIKGIHTDSLLHTKDFSKYLKYSDKIGHWNKEKEGIGLILNTGLYQISNLTKSRGIPHRFINFVCKNKDFEYSYKKCKLKEKCKNHTKCKNKVKPNWFNLINDVKYKQKYTLSIKHMRKIREGIVRDKNLSNVNTMTDIEKSISINSDYKRHWNSKFKHFYDMTKRNIDSKPFYVLIDNYLKEGFSVDNIFLNPLI